MKNRLALFLDCEELISDKENKINIFLATFDEKIINF